MAHPQPNSRGLSLDLAIGGGERDALGTRLVVHSLGWLVFVNWSHKSAYDVVKIENVSRKRSLKNQNAFIFFRLQCKLRFWELQLQENQSQC